jgi:hypothetical protein
MANLSSNLDLLVLVVLLRTSVLMTFAENKNFYQHYGTRMYQIQNRAADFEDSRYTLDMF